HVPATGGSRRYYSEYLGDTQLLAKAIAEGFAFRGQMIRYAGQPRGMPSRALPPAAFVDVLQNHDQVGNRAVGERLGHPAPTHALRAAAAVYLLSPQIPMLFMGEEWNARQPFQFFCDFSGELGDDVRRGRREEFRDFPRDVPEPQDEKTFLASKLRWEDRALP